MAMNRRVGNSSKYLIYVIKIFFVDVCMSYDRTPFCN